MNILFLTSGPHVPSTRYRVLQYVPHLRSLGHRCTVAHSFPPKYDELPALGWRLSQQLKRLVRLAHLARARLGHYDVVCIERELFADGTWSMEQRFRRAARRLVLDVDDAIFLEHPEKFERIAGMCDLVIAGNRFLQEKIAPLNPSVVVIPTCVELRDSPQKQTDETAASRAVLGWIGTSSNLKFFGEIAPALRELAGTRDFELRIIADTDAPLRNIDLSGIDVRFIRWREETAPRQVAGFDVGLMPLTDDEWTRYKCGFKIIQYMAAGVPAVASPVGVNADIIRHGENGFLAATTAEWAELLRLLIDNPGLRQRMGAEGRRTAEREFSVEANLDRFVAALEGTGDIEGASPGATHRN